jgi:hypothetical protein
MFVAKYRSIGEAAIQAGNSESIIRKHYLNLQSGDEAESFFGILPKRRYVAKEIRAFKPGAVDLVGGAPTPPARVDAALLQWTLRHPPAQEAI